MKRIILFLLATCAVFTLQAKNWTIIGEALENDTTLLEQDATNTNVYKYMGEITTGEFKLSDGTNVYIPVCGINDPMGQQIGMEIQMDTSQVGFGVKYVNPSKTYIITLVDGPDPTLEVEVAEIYTHLYMVGGPVNTTGSGWQLSDALELEKDTADQFVFYYRGFLKYNSSGDEPGSIKFLTSKSSWNPAFHPAGSGNEPLIGAAKMRLDGDDTKWEIPVDGSGNGYYVIKLNTLEETIDVQFTPSDADYPSVVYLTGDAMPCGWVNDYPETMTTTNLFEGKYQWTGNVVPGQFKFLKAKNYWGSCYVSLVEDQLIESGWSYPVIYEGWGETSLNDYKFKISEAAICTIFLDLFEMKVRVSYGTTVGINDLENQTGKYSIIGYNGTIKASSPDLLPMKIMVYSIDGRMKYSNSFVSNTEFRIQKGFYIVVLTDLQNRVCKKEKLIL